MATQKDILEVLYIQDVSKCSQWIYLIPVVFVVCFVMKHVEHELYKLVVQQKNNTPHHTCFFFKYSFNLNAQKYGNVYISFAYPIL